MASSVTPQDRKGQQISAKTFPCKHSKLKQSKDSVDGTPIARCLECGRVAVYGQPERTVKALAGGAK